MSSPDSTTSVLESSRFKKMIDAIDSSLKVAIVKTYYSRQWNEFNASLLEIRAAVKESPFLTIMFDGWMWYRNESVLGCVISITNYKFKI